MKSLIASIMILGLVGMVVGVAVQADETVTATVTPKLISVEVTDGTVPYGILALNSSISTLTLNPIDTQTATNDGNVTVNLDIRSSDAIAQVGAETDWDLVLTSVGVDTYRHEYSINGGANWSEFNTDNITYTSLAASVLPDGFQDFDLQIFTPSSTTGSGERAITVTVLATE